MKGLVIQEGGKCSENEKGWGIFNSDQKRFTVKKLKLVEAYYQSGQRKIGHVRRTAPEIKYLLS